MHRKLKCEPKVSLPLEPSPWPIVRNLLEIWKNKPAFRWILHLMKQLDTYIACVRPRNIHVIPVISLKIAQETEYAMQLLFCQQLWCMGTSMEENEKSGCL
ncbi:hypothetical protein DITRI_Ditri18aG0006300 [Diplodiscus trichospermus]